MPPSATPASTEPSTTRSSSQVLHTPGCMTRLTRQIDLPPEQWHAKSQMKPAHSADQTTRVPKQFKYKRDTTTRDRLPPGSNCKRLHTSAALPCERWQFIRRPQQENHPYDDAVGRCKQGQCAQRTWTRQARGE